MAKVSVSISFKQRQEKAPADPQLVMKWLLKLKHILYLVDVYAYFICMRGEAVTHLTLMYLMQVALNKKHK